MYMCVRYKESDWSCICVLGVMYMCVRGHVHVYVCYGSCICVLDTRSDWSCICVLDTRRVMGHVYVCYIQGVIGHVYVCKGSCICVLGVTYMCIRGHVYVC